MTASPALDFHSHPRPHTGYGRMGLDMAAALVAHGVELTEDADVRVVASNIGGVKGFFTHQRSVMWTMWETDHLPAAYWGAFDDVDQVLVPCEANREIFAQHHRDVQVMRLGIGPEWVPEPRPTSGPLVFLAGGRGWERKGADVALQAFCDVDPDAELWLRIEGRIPDHPLLAHPKVRLIERVADMTGLVAKAHCFLAPSRGEGFGLMPLQAMAQGCPTILTGGHGHAEFAHHGWEIATSKTKAISTGIGDPGSWWEPDFGELCMAIEAFVEAPDALIDDAYARAPAIAAEFAWDPERLMTITGAGGRAVKGAFERKAEARMHEVKVTEEVLGNIGPWRVHFVPGIGYLHTWDVKRSLHDSGVLDLEVWDPAGLQDVVR